MIFKILTGRVSNSVSFKPIESEFTIIESEKLHELDFIMRKIDGERNLDRDHGEAQRLHFLRHPGTDTVELDFQGHLRSMEVNSSIVSVQSESVSSYASIFHRISRNWKNL